MVLQVPLKIPLCCFLIAHQSAFGGVPDVLVDDKATASSSLTLREVYAKGKANYGGAAAKAVANLAQDTALAEELKAQAKNAKYLGELSLIRICSIESQCSLEFAYSKPTYKGFFQMGADACKDVSIDIADIDEKAEWKKSCEAGRKFLDLTWQRLSKAGATLTDGTKETLTLLYLTHQLGAGGGPALFKNLDNGTARDAKANKAMLANVPPKAREAIQAGNHAMTELEFYAYWVGSIDAVIAKFP